MPVPDPVIVKGDARALQLPDECVDLIVTSPPYFGLRDYGTSGQLGAEATPAEFIAALVECTREMVRVLKPSGSIFVNLGDKYAGGGMGGHGSGSMGAKGGKVGTGVLRGGYRRPDMGVRAKSLALLPERYRIAAVDELGLIARAVIVWAKPNGLPESVTDRVRRSHEDWVHLTKAPKYFAAVDEIREPYAPASTARFGYSMDAAMKGRTASGADLGVGCSPRGDLQKVNPLGKLPGSVWEIATQPLKVPAELGVDHFAAFPMEWPRRLVLGWSPREVCTACGEGRRPVVDRPGRTGHNNNPEGRIRSTIKGGEVEWRARMANPDRITGYACSCPDTTAPSTPGVVLDPFGGTGTTALVATMLGRQGISVDLSADYVRLAQWRAADPKQRERASRPAGSKPVAPKQQAPSTATSEPLALDLPA